MENSEKEKLVQSIRSELDRIWDDMISDPQRALKDSEAVEQRSRSINYERGFLDARFYRAWCFIFLSRLPDAIEILSSLSERFSHDDLNEDHIKILNALGVAYRDLGDNKAAVSYYSRSLKLSREAGLLDRELTVLNNLGGYFLANKNFEKALNHFLEILDKAVSNDQSPELRSVVLCNTGVCYSKLDRLDLAEKYLNQSRKLSKQMNYRVIDADCLYELALISTKRNDNVSAEKYIEESLRLCRETDNKRLECDLLVMRGDMSGDIAFYNKARDLSLEINYLQTYEESCGKLAVCHEGKGEYEAALRFYKEQFRVEKEMDNLAAEKKISNLEMEYELERNRKSAEFFKTKNLELEESLNWMTLLNRIARETISSLDTESIFNKVFEHINLLMDVTHFHIVMYNEKKDLLEVVKAFDNGIEVEPFTASAEERSSFAAWSIKNRRELIVNNIEEEYPRYIRKPAVYGSGPLVKSNITVPILLRDNRVGAVAILSYHAHAYKEEHVQFLKSLAAFLSIAIENSENYEKVRELNKIILGEKEELEAANKKITELATHDNLTGLINRRVLYEILEESMKQSRRRQENLAVLFIDLDNFKPINDTWGHNAGDKVLVEVARRLRETIRSTDAAARIGGDEFLILLNPIRGKKEAGLVAEKIIAAVRKPIILGDTEISVGMSLGISLFPEDASSAEQLITEADSAMYRIKKESKNGIRFYNDDQ